jgi:hypothetical protein
MTWRDYQQTFKRQQLNPGGAVAYFQRFVDSYPKARSPRQKVLAIDLVIHSFHYSLKDQPDLATRPAGVNLISGRLKDVVRFLDELSGLGLPSPMRQVSREWRDTYLSGYWPQYLEGDTDG